MKNSKNMLRVLVTVLTLAGIMGPSTVYGRSMEESIRIAGRLFKNLTRGVPLLGDHPRFNDIVRAVHEGKLEEAAGIITHPTEGEKAVYDNAIASIPQTFNEDLTPMGERNELSALFLGYARDGHPIDEILWKDRVYYDPTLTNNNNMFSTRPDVHFSTIWRTRSARDSLIEERRPGFPGVGVFTTYPWTDNYTKAGTNRRNWLGILNNLYCVDQSDVQSVVIPDTFVRRDIPRAPGGDPNEYVRNCRTCHSQMDPLMGAFSRYDTRPTGGREFLVYTGVTDKINEVNSAQFPITTDQWHLFVTAEQQRIFGFQDMPGKSFQNYGSAEIRYVSGAGLEEFGKMIAASDGFYRCLSRRLVSQVYLRKDFSLVGLNEEELADLNSQQSVIDQYSGMLRSTKDLRKVFEAIAIHYTQQ